MKTKFLGMLGFFLLTCVFSLSAYADKFTIIFTGNSYSALYPCGRCPSSVGGGVTRRAKVIKDMVSNLKNVIIIDSGNFTAGDAFDRESINPQMDKVRSLNYYKAMEEMGYEVVALGEGEFNLDTDTLSDRIKNARFKFISSNIEMDGVLPYYIKDFSEFKVALIGLSPEDTYKKTGIKTNNYRDSLNKTLAEISNKADLVILLSSLGEEVSVLLAQEFPQIKIILTSGYMSGQSAYEQVGETLIFKPSMGARDLRVVDIDVGDNKVLNWELKKESLSLDVSEDTMIKAMIPACFKDNDCPSQEGFNCHCKDAGKKISACIYSEAKKFSALIISDKRCPFCSIEMPERFLKTNFPGMSFKIIHYKDTQAKDIIEKYNVDSLPLLVLSTELKQEKNFADIAHFFEERDDNLFLKKDISGICNYLKRKEVPSKIDFFLDMSDKTAKDSLAALIDFSRKNKIDLDVHLLMPQKTIGYPLEEIKAALAVKKLYPKNFFDYLLQRIEFIQTQPYINSLESLKMNYKRIKKTTDSKTMEKLFTEDRQLTDELGVTTGNIMFVNNNRIFRVFGIDEQQLKKLFEVTDNK